MIHYDPIWSTIIQIPIIWLSLTSTTATIYNSVAAFILKKSSYWRSSIKRNQVKRLATNSIAFLMYLTPSESQEKPSAHEASWLGWLKAQWVLLYGSEWMIYRYWYTFDIQLAKSLPIERHKDTKMKDWTTKRPNNRKKDGQKDKRRGGYS